MTDLAHLFSQLSEDEKNSLIEKTTKELKLKQFLSKKIELEEIIKAYTFDLDEHLKTCDHPNLIYQDQGSSGDWDREDSYWTVWQCDTCGNRWTTKQDYHKVKVPMLKKYPWAKEYNYWKNGQKKL